LNWRSFYKLLHIIKDDLSVNDLKQAKRGHFGWIVPDEAKLAMALRYLAGGDPKDLFLIYHVSYAYVFKCVWAVVDAINRHLNVEFPINDRAKLATLEAEFRAKSVGGIWEGQVGALDGVFFPMQAPSNKDVSNPLRYYVARKGYYALLCMAVCDAERRILDYDISQVPTTHDSLAWSLSPLGGRILNGDLPDPYFISGDSAFALSPSMITPSGLPEHDDYDYHQSSNRMPIECAFGIIYQRWGVLWRPLRCRFDRRAPLVGACIRLHNFCIDERVSFSMRTVNGFGQVQPGRWEKMPLFDKEGRPVEQLDIERTGVTGRARDRRRAKNARRDRLVELVAASGIKRPALKRGQWKKRRGGRGRRRAG
ncbi:MAG: transposase family protein, partial [Promethearchaeia archaeon]